jgi:hypothetical protein
MSGPRPPRSGFHARDGWYFKRGDGGTVTIRAGDDGPEIALEPHTWASIVASVAASGETSAAYRRALAFHQGDLDLH